MASLNVQLKRERELRGISLRQIAEDTKISVRFLDAIEQDRMDVIPGEFYRRSYLRAYARYLGLDEDRAINDYKVVTDRAQSNAKDVRSRPNEPPQVRVDSEPDPSAEATTVPVWAVAAAVTVGLVLIIWMVSGTGTTSPASEQLERDRPTEQASNSNIAEPEATATAIPASSAPSVSSLPPVDRPQPLIPVDGFAARVQVNEPCWLEIRVDGELVATGLKPTGFLQDVSVGDEMRLWLGNAGGVTLWLNGDRARSLGRTGQVVKDIRITRDNVEEFVDRARGNGMS